MGILCEIVFITPVPLDKYLSHLLSVRHFALHIPIQILANNKWIHSVHI